MEQYKLVQFDEKEGAEALLKYDAFLAENSMEVALVSGITNDGKIEVKKMLVKRVPIETTPVEVAPETDSPTIDAELKQPE